MNLAQFSPAQREAVLDLALLAMYADGHLAAAEDQRVQLLLTALGCASESESQREYDGAVGRISRHSGSVASATAHAAELAKSFVTSAERREVLTVLDRLVESDRHIAAAETDLLAAIKEALGG